ncbi:MAG TPA: cell division protein FtsB [Burkholderiales bacterium]
MPPWRLAFYGLIALLVVLQYPLWLGSGGVLAVWRLQREIAEQRAENARLRERNQALAAEVVDLKQGLAAIEERARIELGMIKNGETFYQVIDDTSGTARAPTRGATAAR